MGRLDYWATCACCSPAALRETPPAPPVTLLRYPAVTCWLPQPLLLQRQLLLPQQAQPILLLSQQSLHLLLLLSRPPPLVPRPLPILLPVPLRRPQPPLLRRMVQRPLLAEKVNGKCVELCGVNSSCNYNGIWMSRWNIDKVKVMTQVGTGDNTNISMLGWVLITHDNE